VNRFVEGFGSEDLRADEETVSAVLHELTVIGEAAKRRSTAFRHVVPQSPQKRIAGIGDALILAHEVVDLDEVR
jgi:uncharacterized protein with HEPN domain